MDDEVRREDAVLAPRVKSLGEMRALPLDFLAYDSARLIVRRELGELDVALAHRICECAILLSGKLIVTILTDVIDQHGAAARTDISATRPSDGASFDLLIGIAVHHDLVSGALGRTLIDARTKCEFASLADVTRRPSLRSDRGWDEASAAAGALQKLAQSLEGANRDGRLRAYIDA